MTVPNGSLGPLGRQRNKWNLWWRDGKTGRRLSYVWACWAAMMKWRTSASRTSAAKVLSTSTKSIWKTFCCTTSAKRLQLADGSTATVTTVYDLTMAPTTAQARSEH
ncbi:hypothetical protein MJ561_17830 [Klebsiella pneumoniae]|nr:hypothetical protein MJ561_17830 [Klebsiella pneumoniae]